MRRVLRPWLPLLLLVSLISAGLALLSASIPRRQHIPRKAPNVGAYEPAPVERYLYAAYPFAGDARLILSNSTMHEVTLSGRLFSPSGRVALLEDVILPAHQQRLVELSDQIARHGREFQSGGVELAFASDDPGIAGQLLLRDKGRQQTIDVPLSGQTNFRSSRLEGLWWLPARDAHMGLIVYNRSEVETTGTVTVSRGDGTVVGSVPLRVGPHHSQELDLKSLRKEAVGEVGGVSIQHDGKPGILVATGFLDVPSRRHTVSLSFADPGTLAGSHLHGAGVQIGKTPFAEERFSGQLFVRNVTNQALPVTPALQCGEIQTALTGFTLQAGAAKRIEVSADAIICESGAVGIAVATPVVGSLLGRWLSIAESSGLVVETALHSFPPGANLSGSDPWWIDEQTGIYSLCAEPG